MSSRAKFGSHTPFWGIFEDSTSQTTEFTSIANPVKINTMLDGFGTEITDNALGQPTRITVHHPSIYNVQFSLQLANNGGQLEDVDIWFRKNSVDIPNSNTVVTVPYVHAGLPGKAVAAWNFVVNLSAGDYVELYWRASSTDVFMPTVPPQISPSRPLTPSVILSVTQV